MDSKPADPVLKRIETPLRLTLAGLWAERLVRSFWPLWTLTIALLALLSFGVQDHLPLEAFWFGAVSAFGGLVWALWHGLRSFRRPGRDDALARLDSHLPGQPLAALRDRQAIGAQDAWSVAVWQANATRMLRQAQGAKAVQPDLRLARRDPYALRYVALTALVMALMFGSVWRLASVSALAPGGAGGAVADGPTWEGWLKPPAYTGKPSLYLNDQLAEGMTLPQGTTVQLRFYGEPGRLVLSETVSGRTEVPPATDTAHEFVVAQGGEISIEGPGGRTWAVTVTPDTPPTVTAEGKITRAADGRFRQPFKAADDHGVVRGQVTIALDLPRVDRRYGLAADPDATEPVVLDLPMPRGKAGRTDFPGTLVDDLSKTLLSNQPVVMTFSVSDAAGQTGQSEPLSVVLPGRRFFDPLAAGLIEMRRDILWARSNAPRTVQILRAITHRPEDFIRNQKAYLRLRVAMKRLEAESAALTLAVRDEIAEELWQIALLVEEGDLTSARERLQRAQDRLDEAIRKGATPEEIDELMQEMRDALNDYMRMLAEEAERRGEESQSSEGQRFEMSQDQLQQMLDKLQQLMEEGKTAEAAELMEQLRQFMENMQVTQGEGGQGQGGPGQQAMRDLGETMRGQQGLSDDAFRDLQDGEEGNNGRSQPGQNGQNGETDDPGAEQGERSLAERQEDLRRRLERLERQGNLPGAGSETGEEGRRNLEDARRAMREAEEALRDGDLGEALDRQAEALDAMRDGMRNLGEALAQENRQEGTSRPDGQQAGELDPREGRDPLGRQQGESLRHGSDRNMLQGDDVYRRAEELLDEIRRRSGEQARPEAERDYLKRLLDLY